jgi:ferric-dicitrate binding protein FerR (iron transport regulator)
MQSTERLQRAQRLNTQATAQLERSQQLQQVLFELQPLPRPSRAIPWLLAPALALAFAAGVWLGRLL